jgi:spore maturation protein CgeB
MVASDGLGEPTRVAIVGSTGGSHIGGSFVRACEELGLPVELYDSNGGWRIGTLRHRIFWHVFGKRPVKLDVFSEDVVRHCSRFKPDVLITTGSAPLSAAAVTECRARGIRCVNFSTDDPFYAGMRMRWFLEALPHYDIVFTPRRSNIEDLRRHGVLRVEYLPFGYDPTLFFKPETVNETDASDLFFAGTADEGRLPFVAAAVEAGFDVRLRGQYWDRYKQTRKVALGHAEIPTLRAEIAACRVALCVVRHENRDGHSMRSFEVPAVGACMVLEDTAEHREMFGEEAERVVYFSSPQEMVGKTRELLAQAETRQRLRESAHAHILQGNNTYTNRLRVMLEACNA